MKYEKLKIGVVALARPTFDVPYAEEVVAGAWKTLNSFDVDLVGSSDLLFDAPAVESAISLLQNQTLDLMLVLQVAFSDSTMTVKLAKNLKAPILLWSFPESRSGGRLRLNSVCGINLAAHALAREGLYFDYLHREPEDPDAARMITDTARAGSVKRRLTGARIGLIGHHPDGFETCIYEADTLKRLCAVSVDFMEISELFERSRAVSDSETDSVYARFQSTLGNLDELEQLPLRKSLQIYSALHTLAAEKGYSGMAVRCWPEVFTDFGGAACGPMAMLNEELVP
jgi:L-fucose isomerase-like protein